MMTITTTSSLLDMFVLSRIENVLSLVFFIIAETDRIRRIKWHSESAQLAAGYGGSIVNAKCSHDADRLQIFAAIGGRVDDVDRMIETLMIAGVSTKRLREASLAGVDVSTSAYTEFAGVFLMLSLRIFAAAIVFETKDLVACIFMALLVVVEAWSWCACWRAPIDRTIFSINVTHASVVIMIPIAALGWFVFRTGGGLSHLSRFWYLRSVTAMLLVQSWLTFMLADAGIDRIARWPWIGTCLTRFLSGRGVPSS